jgi:hypothetical protein
MFWFPPSSKIHVDDTLYDNLSSFFRLTVRDLEENDRDNELGMLRHSIADLQNQLSLLLVIDAREFQRKSNGETLALVQQAINSLLEISTARYIKFIIISEELSGEWGSVSVAPAPIDDLYDDLYSAVTLFSRRVPDDLRRRHPILNSREGLIERLYAPDEGKYHGDILQRYEGLWDRFLGDGKPSKICDIARRITDGEIEELIHWWDPPPEDDGDGPEVME